MGKINLVALMAMVFIASGCSQQGTEAESTTQSSSSSSSSTSTNGNTNDKIVFSREIAPLMLNNCTNCHRSQGGIAPFPLESYNDFYKHRSAIKKAVANRTMPPPGVDNSGTCQDFVDDHWMPQNEIDTIVNWVDSGAPQGDPKFKPVIPSLAAGLNGPKTILKIKEPYVPVPPAGKLDDYRCFVVDPQVSMDTQITAVEVLPDQAKIVHHVIVFKPSTEEAEAAAEEKNGQDGRPGYNCFGAAGVPSSVVGLWGPGSDPVELKDPQTGESLGLTLEAGRKLIIQIHYNIANGSPADQTAIAIKTDPAAKPVKWLVVPNAQLNLEPGLPEVVISKTLENQAMLAVDHFYESGAADGAIAGTGIELSWDLVWAAINIPLMGRDMTIYAVGPHMHQLGRKMQLDLVDENENSTCMANIPKFDFNWQRGYMFKRPLSLKSTGSVKISCSFDTRGRTEVVTFGEGTQDEMCLAFLLVTQ